MSKESDQQIKDQLDAIFIKYARATTAPWWPNLLAEVTEWALATLKKDDEPSITCPQCGRMSFNSNDIENGYCIECHDWTTARDDITQRIAREEARQRANPPAPGAMQGDAGPEHDKYMERIRDPDGHD